MRYWFGPTPFHPICETFEKLDTPVGMQCTWCESHAFHAPCLSEMIRSAVQIQ